MNMDVATFNDYFKSIEVLEAQEQLNSFTAQDWPNLKVENRKKIFKQLKKIATPGFLKKKVQFTAEFLKEAIGRG